MKDKIADLELRRGSVRCAPLRGGGWRRTWGLELGQRPTRLPGGFCFRGRLAVARLRFCIYGLLVCHDSMDLPRWPKIKGGHGEVGYRGSGNGKWKLCETITTLLEL